MTWQSNGIDAWRHGPFTHQLRLALDVAVTGSVDGFWWPHSRNLTDELPALLATLELRLGSIDRVIYHLDEWATAPDTFDFDRHRVRLDGYRHMPARTLEVLGVDLDARLILRTITPLDETEVVTAIQHRGRSALGKRPLAR
ncbi:DUF5994 family protein [Nocardia terpenica]|uniref:Uncharacterized protein n=1 Tax=Nocardia terpenica TaxID=455432 RepID=A0A291RRR0_9NOCA|nr:DUF5994 family protein [Nocardia terpenica]ATL70163.1 hypothetical protein CRH09_32245 [Nocardia terpenica]